MLIIGTHMGIGEDDDLVAVEGLWQVFRDEGLTIHLHLVEADERPVEQDIPDDGHTEQSHEVTEISTAPEQLAESKTHDGTQHKHRLGHDNQSEQQQVNPQDGGIIGNEVLLVGQFQGIGHHDDRWKPAQQSLPALILMTPIVQIEIQIWNQYQ